MDVFNLQSTISLDSSSFFSGLRKSERGMKDFGDKMAMGFDRIKQAAKWLITGAAVKVGVDAVKSLATATANAGDRIDKASQALGLSRKAYQEWEYILSQSGATIDSLGISMKTLTNAIVDGSQDTNDALSTIGLAVSDLEGLSQEQAFEKVVRAFQRLPAGVQKSSAAVKLFGRNGQELLPLLNSDIYSIDILRAKAMDLGLVMSDDAVNASVAYTDALAQADAQTDTDEQAVADNHTAEGESADTNDGTEPETLQTDEPEQRVYEDFLGTITLNKGSRLAHLARKYYGSPYFWVYLYEANKEVIPNPNVIPNGTKIRIPNLPPSMVDPNDPKAIERAKQIEKEILGEQK